MDQLKSALTENLRPGNGLLNKHGQIEWTIEVFETSPEDCDAATNSLLAGAEGLLGAYNETRIAITDHIDAADSIGRVLVDHWWLSGLYWLVVYLHDFISSQTVSAIKKKMRKDPKLTSSFTILHLDAVGL
jgi:hypothetical protein